MLQKGFYIDFFKNSTDLIVRKKFRLSGWIFLWTFISLIINTLALYAQADCKASLSGYLHNQKHEALVGASVYMEELKKGVITDQTGKYQISGICAGIYTLKCQFMGYQSIEIKIQIIDNQSNKDFEMEDEAIHLAEIAIQGEKEKLESTQTQTVQSISGQDLEKTRGKNLGEALKEINGVNALQTGSNISKPVIQGLHSNRILILNNGIRHEGQQWGSEHAPEIDPFMATKLTVIKGAATVRYGADAIGGVVIVEPAPLKNNKSLGGELNLIGISNGRGGVSSGILEGGLAKGWGWRVQGTYKQLGDSETPKYMLSNTGVKEVNFSGAIGLKRASYGLELFYSRFSTELGILRSAHIGNLTDLKQAIYSPQPLYIQDFNYEINNPRQKIQHQLAKLNGFFKWNNGTKLDWQYGFQLNNRREFDIRRGGRSDKASLDLSLYTQTLDLNFQPKVKGNWQTSLGVQGLLQDNYYNADTGIRPLIPQYQSAGLGLFGIEKWYKNKWEWEAGLRYDYRFLEVKRFDNQQFLQVNQFNFHNLTASLGLIYNWNSKTVLRSNLATAWRPPNVAELYSEGLHHGVGAIEEGLLLNGASADSVKSEKAIKWISTFSFNNLLENPARGWVLEISPYYNYIQNYIFLEPKDLRLTIRGAFPVFQYRFTNAQFVGLDASIRKYFTRELFWQTKLSFLSAKDVQRNGYLPFIPANRVEGNLTYQKENWVNLKNFYLSGGFAYTMRQYRAPQVFTIDEIEQNQNSLPTTTYDWVNPPSDYFLLHINTGLSLQMGTQLLAISLSINNLLNTSYRDYMNRFRYYSDDIGRNITLRLKYSFNTKK